jgi:hypothetical protein
MKKLFSTSAVVFVSLGVAACGSSSSSGAASTTGAARPQGGGFAARLTAAQQSCIKKQGVTLPAGRRGNGRPPTGTNGAPPAGRPQGGNANSAQVKKLRAAFSACGIQRPARPGAPAASNG